MQQVRIFNLSKPNTQPVLAGYCKSFLCRLRGLMFRRSLSENEGLLLVQPRADRMDAAIHMLFMRFDITAVWVDAQNRVVDVKLARRWRPAYIPSKAARYVLETHPSRYADFHPGDQLQIDSC
jgi:uncharacterized membrane protein (UPF0127 family)